MAEPKSHPLGPLTAQEIVQAANLIRACWPEDVDCHFKVVTLHEPAKAELAPYLVAERAGETAPGIDRRAFVVYYFRGTVSHSPNSHPSHERARFSQGCSTNSTKPS